MKHSTAVDKLGELQAQIAELKQQESALKEKLAASGSGTIEGSLFRATIIEAEVERTDWRNLLHHVEKLKGFTVHPRTHDKFTTIKGRVTVKVTSRKGK